MAYSALVSSVVGVLTISTDKAAYQQGERSTFTVRNNGFSVLEFPTPGLGFRVMNLDISEYVSLGRIHPYVIHYIYPLAWETPTWDQKELTTSGETD